MLFPTETTFSPLAGGDSGTYQTLSRMRDLVGASQGQPEVRAAVLSALRGVRERDAGGEVAALFDWVRSHFRYTLDPVDVELVQAPRYMLETIRREGIVHGDCDDAALLFAALAETAGYQTRFVVQGPDAGDFSHVLIEVLIDGAWVPVDASQRQFSIGWKPHREVTREEREMRTLGQTDASAYELQRAGEQEGYAADAEAVWSEYLGVPQAQVIATAAPNGWARTAPVVEAGFSLADLFGGLREIGETAVPLLERYGVVKPITGYTAAGKPMYAGQVAPVGGVPGAFFSQATAPVLFGLNAWQLLLLGGGALVVFVIARR